MDDGTEDVDLTELEEMQKFLTGASTTTPSVATNTFSASQGVNSLPQQQQQSIGGGVPPQYAKPQPQSNIVMNAGQQVMNKPNIIINTSGVPVNSGGTSITSSTTIGAGGQVGKPPAQYYPNTAGGTNATTTGYPPNVNPQYRPTGTPTTTTTPQGQPNIVKGPINYPPGTAPSSQSTTGIQQAYGAPGGPMIAKGPPVPNTVPGSNMPIRTGTIPNQPGANPYLKNPSQPGVPMSSGSGTTAAPSNSSPINNQIQNHFNALALAYRNGILKRDILMSHLETLFGKQYTTIYTEKIDNIPVERVPPLPQDFNLQKILDNTPKIKDLALSQGKSNTPNPSTTTPTSNPNPTPSPTNPNNFNNNVKPLMNNVNPIQSNINSTTINTSNTIVQPQSNMSQINSTPSTITTPTSTTTINTPQPTLQPTNTIVQQSNINSININNNINNTKDLKRKKPGDNEKEDNFEKQNIKDLNDVTKIAMIDMKNETDHFLPDFGEEDENYTPEAEPLFLNSLPLRKKLCSVANRNGIKIQEENSLAEFLSLACQDYLRNVLEFLVKTCQQRLELQKEDLPTAITSDVKKKLQLIEKREKDERLRREAEENEKILQEAKKQEQMSKKKYEEKTPLATREKLAKAKMEEEENKRALAANNTAMVALGNVVRKKSTPLMSKTSHSLNPPVPSPALQQLLQIVKEGKSLTPEQIPLYHQYNQAYEQQLAKHYERVASQIQQGGSVTGNLDQDGSSKTLPSSSLMEKSKSLNKITKKDCLFSHTIIKPHIIQKYELLKLQKKKNSASTFQLLS
ncbi:hypothetical protein DLAC_05760 [Tieghemostelium lacteum]|uniref:Transcription initiation factor TFIID component TAF4 C-terminal domain-containing protein n=1 Tax=Tieghemostelium lacteum TaxID=361077 RepID=A0A151ZGM8_TIELA|nr:hypothetical protein DLAC_05760 [Tieghemostelium lacteum]|eukprot:KYQ93131.1 hypothetical protein DLAC_05760 [Tieghemostelium lacteum]